MLQSLRGKTALVTGASRGIGPRTGHLVRDLGDSQPTMTDRVAARVCRIRSARAPSPQERK